MTFDHDFCYFILLFSSLLKKEGREKENDVAKIVIKSHTSLFHQKKCKLVINNSAFLVLWCWFCSIISSQIAPLEGAFPNSPNQIWVKNIYFIIEIHFLDYRLSVLSIALGERCFFGVIHILGVVVAITNIDLTLDF